jgi:hypothetical protein
MEKVIQRRWRDADLEPFAAMNADPEVMRYFVESGLFPKPYLSSDNVKGGFFNPLYKLVSENNAVK